MPVLIISQYDDLHTTAVCKQLDQLNLDYFLFERYRKDHLITIEYGPKKNKIRFNCGDSTYFGDEVSTVFWRPKPIIQSELPGNNATLTEQFCKQEWHATLRALEELLGPTVKWANKPSQVSYLSKPYQLALAQSEELLIPATIISNNETDVKSLVDKTRVINKSVSSFVSFDKLFYTSEIEHDALKDINSIRIAPGIFQELIEKKFEYRVTIIGENIFTALIDSQKNLESTLDWRKGEYKDMFSKGRLPGELEKKLMNFHQKAGLIIATYDIIQTTSDEFIFLECNPSGQWLWKESDLGLQISEAIANELAQL